MNRSKGLKRFNRLFFAFLLVIMAGTIVTSTGTLSGTDNSHQPEKIIDFVRNCYDGKGYAEYPGGQ